MRTRAGGAISVPRRRTPTAAVRFLARGRNCRSRLAPTCRRRGEDAGTSRAPRAGSRMSHLSTHLEENLRALAARHPRLAAEIAAAAPLPSLPEPTPAGDPTLTADGVLLHSRHDPRREAARWAEAQRERLGEQSDATAVVLGLGLGYHLEALAAAWPGPIVVVESDRALWRTALAARNLGAVLARVAVEAGKPDLVLALAQAPLDAAVLAEIGRRGVLRAFWFVEDHRLLTYWQSVIAEYDYFFAIQQGAFLEEAARRSAARVAYLPCAADPAVHRPLALTAAERAELGAPLAFVGAGYRNRRIAFRPLLDLGLKIWGTEWAGAGQVEAAVQRDGARISTEDAVRIFNATRVNLNLHSSTYVDGVDPRGDFVNPRTFELAAAGAFQLVDRRTLLPPLLRPDEEVATFTDAAELHDLVRHYLAHPEERAWLAATGRTRVLAEHTYRHRMQRLLETIAAGDHEPPGARAAGRRPGVGARPRPAGTHADRRDRRRPPRRLPARRRHR